MIEIRTTMISRQSLHIVTLLLCRVLALATIGCASADSQDNGGGKVQDQRFIGYWNQGKAELTRYSLEQARYGEIRQGDAVLVFVTEDFLTTPQVKLESEPKGRPYMQVLKMNMMKNFITGIYPYSMMTSVFTPIEIHTHPHSLKLSTSVQEWCGHVYAQLNLKGGKYSVESHSYFEREGDQEFTLEGVTLEDEIWTMIRLDPKRLPTGSIRIIPGTMAARLRHTPLTVENATATLSPVKEGTTGRGTTMRYTLDYGNARRTLSIEFRSAFPYEIMGWNETYADGFGPNAKQLTTRAVRTNSLMIDYWAKNATGDTTLRQELGLHHIGEKQ